MEKKIISDLNKYKGLSKKLLRNYGAECDRIGSLVSTRYNDKQRENKKEIITKGDRLFLLLFREWTDLLHGVQCICENNFHRNSIPIVRTMYEIFLFINYLAIDQNEMDAKARCYEVFAVWKRMKDCQKDISYKEKHPDITWNEFYDPEVAYKVISRKFEQFLTDDDMKLVKDAIEELTEHYKGKFYGPWYTVHEYLKSHKFERYSLKKMSSMLNEKLKIDLFLNDGIMFLYNQVYDEMSRYAHGYDFTDRIREDDHGSFFSPANYPKNNTFILVFIRMMFFDIIFIISNKYFCGKGEDWNSCEKLKIHEFNEKQDKIIEKLRQLDRNLP